MSETRIESSFVYGTSSVYVLVDPRTDDHRYVGRTCRTIETRLAQHVSEARRARFHTAKDQWIRELAALGMKPRVELLERPRLPTPWAVDEGNYLISDLEQRWIRECIHSGCPLLNVPSRNDSEQAV